MSSGRACDICGDAYGGRVVPTILTCCLNHVCFDCAENYRNSKISELAGNKKKIKCMYCNQLFHSSKDTPWKVNKPFIEVSGIDVDLSGVKEAQTAMQLQAVPASKARHNNNNAQREMRATRAMAQHAPMQGNAQGAEDGDGEEADSTREDPPPFERLLASTQVTPSVRQSSRAISGAGPREREASAGEESSSLQETMVSVLGERHGQLWPNNRQLEQDAEESELEEVAAPRSRRPSQRQESIEARSPSRRVSRRARGIGGNVAKEDSEESDTNEVAPRPRGSSQQPHGKTRATIYSRMIARARGNARRREEDSDESDNEETETRSRRSLKQSPETEEASISNRRVSSRSRGNVSYLEKDSDDEEFTESSSEEDEQSGEEVSESGEDISESDVNEEEVSTEEDISRRKRKRGPQNRGSPQTKRSFANGKAGPIFFPDLPKWPSVSKRRIPQVGVAVLTLLREADYDELFHRPVCEDYPESARDYLLNVENPMDFSTIEEERLCSYEHITDLQEDLILTFRNCCVYNGQGHEYTNYAIDIWQSLNEVFEEAQSQDMDGGNGERAGNTGGDPPPVERLLASTPVTPSERQSPGVISGVRPREREDTRRAMQLIAQVAPIQEDAQDTEDGNAEEARSTREDPPPVERQSASTPVTPNARQSSRAISGVAQRERAASVDEESRVPKRTRIVVENPSTASSPQETTLYAAAGGQGDQNNLLDGDGIGPSGVFTRQAFLSNTIFHLNPLINAKKKKNEAFALFIREGVATLFYDPLPSSINVDTINNWTHSELRDFLSPVAVEPPIMSYQANGKSQRKSCELCRKIKRRCVNSDPTNKWCDRCFEKGLECIFLDSNQGMRTDLKCSANAKPASGGELESTRLEQSALESSPPIRFREKNDECFVRARDGQTARWLKNATAGSFIVMRHEYAKCRFCPKRLKEGGQYIGPVYVIGMITRHVEPRSAEEKEIAENGMGEIHNIRWNVNTLCKVDWKWMGYKKDLKPETKNYLNLICQPTFQKICKNPTMQDIRKDLWDNASVEISSEEFPDRFHFSKEGTNSGKSLPLGDQQLWLSALAKEGVNVTVSDVTTPNPKLMTTNMPGIVLGGASIMGAS